MSLENIVFDRFVNYIQIGDNDWDDLARMSIRQFWVDLSSCRTSYLLDDCMDQRVLQFATGGHWINENKLDCFEHKEILFFNCNGVALFTVYAMPASGKLKGVLGLWTDLLKWFTIKAPRYRYR